MSVTQFSWKKRWPMRQLTRCSLVAFAAMSLAGCQTASLSGPNSGDISTASVGQASIKGTAEAGKRWEANKGDVRLGLDYAGRLKALGQRAEQLNVLAELARMHPENTRLQSAYGKELVVSGQSARGEAILRGVVKSGKSDWKTYSALGSALDQQGKHTQARGFYQAALKAQPGEVSILNNMGMSYLLEGKLNKAEEAFKNLDAMPNSSKEPRIRQNLALSVGLQGRFDEARSIASRDLPPEAVEANLAYLKKMLAQSNTWEKLQSANAQPTSG